MREAPFITRPLSILLDLARGLAAMAVLVGHGLQFGFYTGPTSLTMAFQHNAVTVFFVLSGLVIATSVDSGRVTLPSYVLARASRILPVAIPALLIAAAVAWLDASLTVPLFGHDIGGVRASDMISGLLFLTESYQIELPMNPPYWSLCYEVWYYALFAAATFLHGRKRLVWLVLLAIFAGPNALLLMPVWLVGVALARVPQARAVPPMLGTLFIALALIGLAAVPLAETPLQNLLRTVVPWAMGYSLYALSDVLLAIAVALGFAGLRAVTGESAPLLEQAAGPIRYVAGFSFSLYLLHWPVLKLLRIAGMPASSSVLGFVGILIIPVVAGAAFASVTEHRRHAVRVLLEKAIGRWRTLRAAPDPIA
jgi:peptidoglycan/LPS O-acetylase OafA/YrhL